MQKERIIHKIRDAGVVGAGGGGFPAAVKLTGEFKTYIANGAECEPLLNKDLELMEQHVEDLLKTVDLLQDSLGLNSAYFAAKEKYSKVWTKASQYLDKYSIIPAYLDDIFPIGDEFELVYRILNRTIPPAQIPLSVNAVVNNVETILNIGNALSGKPVTEKWLTVSGDVEYPFTAIVPIGTPASVLLDFAKPKLENFALIEGGPMMGIIAPLDEPVKKTTSGFLVFPPEHPVVTYRKMPLEYVLRIAASACSQCRICTDLCPRYLLGHPLEPHKIMRSAAMPMSLPVDVMTAVLLCSECGICEQFACPMGLSPKRINQELKKRFREKDIRFQWNEDLPCPKEERGYRQIQSQRLAEKIGILQKLNIQPDFIHSFPEPERVIVRLLQHAGVPAEPIVRPGETVVKAQKIADIPHGKLGAPLHSPIDGHIIEVKPNIIIQR